MDETADPAVFELRSGDLLFTFDAVTATEPPDHASRDPKCRKRLVRRLAEDGDPARRPLQEGE